MRSHAALLTAAAVAVSAGTHLCVSAAEYVSHPPTRPLPAASSRPVQAAGRDRHVDPRMGSDENSGQADAPWRTVQHAVEQLAAGDVLYLRGGVYYEHVTVAVSGTARQPIVIRSHPGELAVVDGGLREFFERPEDAWEAVADGAPGEYRSRRAFPDLESRAGAPNVLGNFGDSMIPLQGYRFLEDLRSSNEYFHKFEGSKSEAGEGVYCGPGLYYDIPSGRIHARLAHTRQPALGEDNYGGVTDPRQVPLVIAGAGSPLSIQSSRYLRLQDLVVRGALDATISVDQSHNIEFDGVTAYGGKSAMSVRDCGGVRLWNCALRGIAAPWTFRGNLKYRSFEGRIFSASGWAPTGADNHDFELAYSEFTDCVDGVFIGNVHNVQFHHNLLDNLSDDGIFLTARTAYDGSTPGGNVHIYQNRLARCLTTFAFGVGHGRQKMTAAGRQTGSGVYIYRNVFDFRRPVMYTQPKEDESSISSYGRVSGDHGGPLWEPMAVWHNTFLHVEPPWRGYYLSGLGGHLGPGARRRLFNNLVVQATGPPGGVLPLIATPANAKAKSDTTEDNRPPIDFAADGNLHWSYDQPSTGTSLLGRFRNSPSWEASKQKYPPGWTTHDVVADPQLVQFEADWRRGIDCRLAEGSPAVDAGVTATSRWVDPLRDTDQGRPDIGAIPAGAEPWSVGVGGRLTVCGAEAPSAAAIPAPQRFLLPDDELPPPQAPDAPRVVVVKGYPAFDAPLIEFALRRARVPFDTLERTWLDPAEYEKYAAVIVVGNLARAKIEPNQYSAADLPHVQRYLEQGGALVLARGNTSLLASNEGRKLLARWTGSRETDKRQPLRILQPDHRWLSHLESAAEHAWIDAKNVQPLRATLGERVIGSPGMASLCRVPVGEGQLIYVGWDIAGALPHGRNPSTVEMEAAYEDQAEILFKVVVDAASGGHTP